MGFQKLLSKVLSLIILAFLLLLKPAVTMASVHHPLDPIVTSLNMAALKYEVKEKTSLKNPVVDPNFNTLRNKDMNTTQAIVLVGVILIIAVIAPVVTWWYFSN